MPIPRKRASASTKLLPSVFAPKTIMRFNTQIRCDLDDDAVLRLKPFGVVVAMIPEARATTDDAGNARDIFPVGCRLPESSSDITDR
jgi:hypothetical protein